MLIKPDLRGYQESLARRTYAAMHKGDRRILDQLETGGGKTRLASRYAYDALSSNERIVILAHRIELLRQFEEEFNQWGIECGYIASKHPSQPLFPVQLCMVKTLANRAIPPADLVIVDEAHHTPAETYRQVLGRYHKAKIIGLTATPERTDGQGLDQIFDTMVCGPPTHWMIKQGYLSPYRILEGKAADLSNVKVVAGDYDKGKLSEASKKKALLGDVTSTWLRHASGLQTIVFCVDTAHARAVFDRYLKIGANVAYLDGDTPKEERDQTIAMFRDRQIKILINVELFIEGLNCPGIECVQLLRPTMSRAYARQMIGRGLRPGKPECLYLDHAGIFKQHGEPDKPVIWTMEGGMRLEEYRDRQSTQIKAKKKAQRLIVADESAEMVERYYSGTDAHWEDTPVEAIEYPCDGGQYVLPLAV